jgi:hypothetical protein
VHVHRARTLTPDEVTARNGIPVTTVARTLFDLARRAGNHDLERAFAYALGRGLANREEVQAVCAAHVKYITHRRRCSESDRRRDGVLAAAGVHVIRVTWRQLVNEPEALLGFTRA